MITLLATIASGLVPALLSSRGNAAEMMKEGGRGNSSRLVNVITRILVVGQIALTAALLIAATLKSNRSETRLKLDYGYDENAVYSRADGFDGRRLPERGRAPANFSSARCARCAPILSSSRPRMTDRFRMTFAARASMKSTAKII